MKTFYSIALLLALIVTMFFALNIEFNENFGLAAGVMVVVDFCLYCKVNPINENGDE